MLRLDHDLAEMDRHGTCRVYLPDYARWDIAVELRVEVRDVASGKVVGGVVKEYNKIAWIARVRIDD